MLKFASLVLILTVATPAFGAVVSSEQADADYETGWYRSIRLATWQWEGLAKETLTTVLSKIQAAEGSRRFLDRYDTILEYGPGHWTYEFINAAHQKLREADGASASGKQRDAFRATMDASILFTLASYPHLPDVESREALQLAYESYSRAGALMTTPFETWQLESRDVTFPVFVHLPATNARHVPVVLKTGGMDVLSTEFHTLAEQLTEMGIAMVAFDMPGNGNNGVVDFETDRHHQVVLDRVLSDPRLDSDNIYVWSESLGGHPAVRVAKTRSEELAGVINSCGLLHSVHALALPGVPDDIDFRALVSAYKAGQLPQKEIDGMNRLFSSSPEMQAQTENFQYEVYTNRVGANAASLIDVAAKGDPVSLLHQGILGAGIVTDVPILSINTQRDPIVPATDTLMAVQASSEGTMVLFGDHEGHCAARSKEMPVAIQWLQTKIRENQ